MSVYEHIINIADILGIELCQPPLIYEYKITTYYYDDIVSIIHHQIQKIGNDITYVLKTSENDTITEKSVELKSIRLVNDIFCNFVRDSYYDSPILFNNLKKIEEDNDTFINYYRAKPGYFYMGVYKSDGCDRLNRVYVKRNKDKYYNEYEVI